MSQADKEFFGLQTERSKIKSLIVSEYFLAWARVILNSRRMATPYPRNNNIHYMELYCGPGEYDDGTPSTPIMVIDIACEHARIAQHLVMNMVDNDPDYCAILKGRIAAHPRVSCLKHQPRVTCSNLDGSLASYLSSIKLVPTFLFADPWGYAGLSRDLFEAVLKRWGSECVFFFNYNRINAAITNPMVSHHIEAIFGEQEAQALRAQVPSMTPSRREKTILASLHEAFQREGHRYVHTFAFLNARGTRTSHYLVSVSKHFRGYHIMRDVMAKHSSNSVQGVPTMMYDPRDGLGHQLFEVGRPLDDLKGMLLEDLADRTIGVAELYEEHSVGRPYTLKNYKTALRQLYDDGRIATDRCPRKGTFANTIVVTFPKRH